MSKDEKQIVAALVIGQSIAALLIFLCGKAATPQESFVLAAEFLAATKEAIEDLDK